MNQTASRLANLFILTAVFSSPSLAYAQTDHLQARVFFFDRCPSDQYSPVKAATGFAPLVGALISAVAAPVAKGIVGLGASAVTKAASDTEYLLPSQTGVTAPFYNVDPAGDLSVRENIRCVVVIAATWGNASNPSIEKNGWVGKAMKYLNQQNLDAYPTATPQLYFEAKYMASDSLEKFSLKPESIFVGSFEQSSSWGRDKRKFLLELNFVDVDTGTVFAKPAFTFEKIKAPHGRIICRTQLPDTNCTNESVGDQSEWFPVAPLSEYLKKHVAERERNAAFLAVIDTPIELVGKAPLEARDAWSKSPFVATYCEKLAKYNEEVASLGRENSSSLLRIDNQCPLVLTDAQSDAQRAIASAILKLQFVDAFMLFEQKCSVKKDSWKGADKVTIDAKRRLYFDSFPNNLDLSIFPPKPPKGSRFAKCLEDLRNEIIAFGTEAETPLSSGGRFQTVLTVKETRYGSAFAKWLAPVVEQAKDGVATVIVDAIDPIKRAAADETKRVNNEFVVIADQEVAIAKAKYDAALAGSDEGVRLAAKLDLLKAKKDANAAYAAAKLSVRYPGLE
jgi:hypothetical protein